MTTPEEPPVEWLDDEEMTAWRGFIETVFDLLRALEADLANDGLTIGDYQVLVHLSESPDESMRMSDLASLLQLTPSGLTRRLDGLVRSGDVERVPGTEDRRVILAHLTEAGRARLTRAAPDHVASVRRWFITPLDGDLASVGAAFLRVRQALHPDRPTSQLY